MESKIKNFDGSGNIENFLEKVKLKGYQQEKAAQNLAAGWKEGPAFDVSYISNLRASLQGCVFK